LTGIRPAESDERKSREAGSTRQDAPVGLADVQEGETASLSAVVDTARLRSRGSSHLRSASVQLMQSTYGNRAVQRYLGSTPSPLSSASHNGTYRHLPVQRVLGIEDALGGAWDKIKDTAEEAWDWTKGKAGDAVDWGKETAEEAVHTVKDQFEPRDAGFDTLAAGGIAENKAPKNISLPWRLQSGMEDAWDKSFPDGAVQEQGGILVQEKNGKYKWKAGKPLSPKDGGNGSFSPNYGDQTVDEKLVGTGHTHPYESGRTNVPFSGQDLSTFIYTKEQFQMVQSGKGQYGAARTAEFDKSLKDLDYVGKHDLAENMQKEYDKVFNDPKIKGTVAEKARAATLAVTKKYHLLFYEGKDGKLALQ